MPLYPQAGSDADHRNLALTCQYGSNSGWHALEHDHRGTCIRYRSQVKFQLFDASVNHGRGNAIRFLQRAVKVADDGDWGVKSQAALESMEANDVLLRFLAYRLKFWASLQKFDIYGRGWTNRGADNLLFAAEDN